MKVKSANIAKKDWRLKVLTLTVSSMSCVGIATNTHADDLEIYTKGQTGSGPTIMLVLSNSVTMGNDKKSYTADYGIDSCTDLSKITSNPTRVELMDDDGKSFNPKQYVSYNTVLCSSNPVGKQEQRVSKLVGAFVKFFANPKPYLGNSDIKTFNVGLAVLFGNAGANGGYISVPAKPMTLDNRKAIISKLTAFEADQTSTPLELAYAEVGSYLMGTNLDKSTDTDVYTYRFQGQVYNSTVSRCDSITWNLGTSSSPPDGFICDQPLVRVESVADFKKIDSSTTIVTTGKNPIYYYEKRASRKYSGFSQSDSLAKLTDRYKTPLAKPSQCSGNGMFFLTDGLPAGFGDGNVIRERMNLALANQTTDNQVTSSTDSFNYASCESNTTLQLADTKYNGGISYWQCIGNFARILSGGVTVKPETGDNFNLGIKTAVMGMGANAFTPFYTKDANNNLIAKPKSSKTITENGVTKTVQAYDCAALAGKDTGALNACKWGELGYGYGNGGFYFANDAQAMGNGFGNFILSLTNDNITPVSTGTMSVPLDTLNTQKSRGFAYLPILDPKPGAKPLWFGNLKKYNIQNTTLVDATKANTVFKDASGEFATNTYDLWAKAQTADGAKPQVGGSYSQIFENTGNTRNLFVNTGNNVTSVGVVANKFTGFNTLKASLATKTADANTTPDSILKNVATFLGYAGQTTAIVDGASPDTTAVFNENTKNLGGVLHSLPQLVTYSVDLNKSGAFDNSTRKDYVLYGSMDGSLHLVDDSTGKEQFTFIPKELLELQHKALIGAQTAENGSQPFGVDAPWLVNSSYKIDTTSTPKKYTANQIFATGGLRMGGSSYYSLDITNSSTPSMIYSIGSNYANTLQGTATSLVGMRNGTLGTAGSLTDEQKAYSVMGQSWGKPSIGYVMSGGKKVMVNFLPGGYDTCYENSKYKPSNSDATLPTACQNKSTSQGNSVYMVRVGEEAVDSTTKLTSIKTDSDSGKLLWWVTQGANSDATSASSSLQSSNATDMKDSIITEIRAFDRNYDGLTDHIYFADLGGRVWRADINNDKNSTNFKVDRVIKVLDVSGRTGNDAPPRFYERPLVTFTNDIDSNIQAVVTVGTGNRSAPYSDRTGTADAIYTFIDKDIARADLFSGVTDTGNSACTGTVKSTKTKLNTMCLTTDDLTELKFATTDSDIRKNMKLGTTQGWYYPLTNWVDSSNTIVSTKGLKMFNEPDAQAGLLFATVYNPNESGIGGTGCAAGVQGVTQRILMCLPFGNCGDTNTTITTPIVSKAGAGIVDNIITQGNAGSGGYSVVKTYCKGADCDTTAYDPSKSQPPGTTGFGVETPSINRMTAINPQSWWEK